MLKLFNTMVEKAVPFKAFEDKKVKMYTCGPSIYLLPHIGNYRTFLFEDILQRYLEYCGYEVTRLITLTDVEDKAIVEAERENSSLNELTKKNMEIFFADMKLLRMKTPTYFPRSSTTVGQAVKLIRILLKNGYAYQYKNAGRCNVYFDPLKFKDFGKLSKLDMKSWPKNKRRFHKDTYPGTPWNMGDFILWHGCNETDKICWNSKIGRGRPAWNIQDAAMITKCLESPVDIACGGIDNLVRHHDYTIAIIESVLAKEAAHYWLHAQHLLVDGRKMSKSKGNVYYPIDLIKMGYTKEQVRLLLIYVPYRRRLNFTLKKLEAMSGKMASLKKSINSLSKVRAGRTSKRANRLAKSLVPNFERHMNNDLDVKAAFDNLIEAITQLGHLAERGELGSEAQTVLTDLRRVDEVLQVIF